MRRNPDYLLTELNHTPYLLPFGQAIANRCHSFMLNETGAEIWNILKKPHTKAYIIKKMSEKYVPDDLGSECFSDDIHLFLAQMQQSGLLLPNANTKTSSARFSTGENLSFSPKQENAGPPVYQLKIGTILLKLYGNPSAFCEEFQKFTYRYADSDKFEQTLCVYVTQNRPPSANNAPYIMQDPQLCVRETDQTYHLEFSASRQLHTAILAKDGARAVFYCSGEYNDELRFDIFHGIRSAFLYTAGMHGMYALHSASLKHSEKAWLFSGPSGTGKSTHTNLWKQYYDTPIINGDLNLLAVRDGIPVVYGMPWCGTSGICDTCTYELGGIVFLKKSPENHLITLMDNERELYAIQRMISPLWTPAQLQNLVSFIHRITPDIFITKLECNISKEAVDLMMHAIDSAQN